jgi:hypothetical protein
MRGFRWTGFVVAASLCIAAASVPDGLRIGAFSAADPARNLPKDWERLTLSKADRQTSYDLVAVDTTVAVRAVSRGGASGLIRRQRIDPTAYPMLTWRWRVKDTIAGGNAFTKDGDDFAARLFVTFDHDPGLGGRLKRSALRALGYDDVPTRALNYVWANRAPTDTVFASAHTDWVQMIPVERGSTRAGAWVVETRNVRADYRRAFGEAPPALTGVALMTDTDNTGGSATAYYGDIVFHRTARDLPVNLDLRRD